MSDRRQSPGSADLNFNVLNYRRCLFSREFKGDRTARRFADDSEARAQSVIVHVHDYAVYQMRQTLPYLINMLPKLHNPLNVRAISCRRIRLKPQRLANQMNFFVSRLSNVRNHVVRQKIKFPLGRDFRI